MSIDTPHADYVEHLNSMDKCRTVVKGSTAVKLAGELYLPKLVNQSQTEYESQKSRTLFLEATSRTIQGLLGLMFSKKPNVEPSEEENIDIFNSFVGGSESVYSFARDFCQEVLTTGRAGILVDVADSGVIGSTGAKAYFTVYEAESIINWRIKAIAGQDVISMVVLKEYVDIETEDEFTVEKTPQYRVLKLSDEEGAYTYTFSLYQEINFDENKHHSDSSIFPSSKQGKALKLVDSGVPTSNGIPLDRIPFYICNSNNNSMKVGQPPLLGLCEANISHYIHSSLLENILTILANPILLLTGTKRQAKEEDNKERKLGVGVMWEFPGTDVNMGYVEANGNGISHLRELLAEKLQYMQLLGSSILKRQLNFSESWENQKEQKATENSVISNLADLVGECITSALKKAAEWQKVQINVDNIKFSINKYFAERDIDINFVNQAVELYGSGLIRTEDMIKTLKVSGHLAEDATLDEVVDKIEEFRKNSQEIKEGGIERGDKLGSRELPRTSKKDKEDKNKAEADVQEDIRSKALRETEKRALSKKTTNYLDKKGREGNKQDIGSLTDPSRRKEIFR